ncbi:SHOCT domain-containing protein [Donghicola tyrosinivorans]|uniref:Putative membrane protein n=1 Tax=Donghicola tyrosinivorans TaxID=1652492 RepID=A0A2T0WUF1_9RHOB|nr:SHOCT domain-containing protein [Donghicola tyrosinivorans]PRY90310.1 putative membrane protein [Donghicola tyrosinivorans]
MKWFAIPLIFLAGPALADRGEYYGHMMDGYGVGMMFGPVLWLIVLGLVVAGVVWFIRQPGNSATPKSAGDAMAELDMRLARGDIDPEDYAARKKLLAE